jgi:ribose transport system ATP-binding protein
MMKQSTASKPRAALLEARRIHKSFPGVQALDDVRLFVRRGTVHAVVGENGAGKSTLMKILAGVFPPDQGEVVLEGRPVRFTSPRQAQDAGIAIIFQELNLVPNLSVAENIFLGREPRNRLGLIDFWRMHADARRLLDNLGARIAPQTPVERLSIGAQQLVEIARALSFDAKVIIMDEPTSAITDQEIKSLFRLIRELKQRGVAIVYITHKLDELGEIADDVTVLRDGRCVGTRAWNEVTRDEIVRMMVGRALGGRRLQRSSSSHQEVLRVAGVSLRHPERPGAYLLDDVSFTVHRGEVVGVFGLMGAGRTELLLTIFGLHPSASGQFSVAGRVVDIRSPRDAIRAGVALAPEDRKTEGLILSMTIAENASLASLEQLSRWFLLQTRREQTLVRQFADRLRVRTPTLTRQVRQLSGGNQQKVVLCKWLATRPKVLLLDEPTRGIDISAKQEIYAVIRELAASGLGVVFVSSEMPEILALADRILVLSEGRLTAEFSQAQATEELLLQAALPRGARREDVA